MTANYALLTFQLLVFIIMLYLMVHMYRQLRRDATRVEPPVRDVAHDREMRSGVNELIAELRKAADQINADITARSTTLQKLIDEADNRMRALDSMHSRSESLRRAESVGSRSNASTTGRVPGRPSGARANERAIERAAERTQERPVVRQEVTPAVERVENVWPGAPVSEPIRTLPYVATASPAAGSAYRQAARVSANGAPPPPPPTMNSSDRVPEPITNADDAFVSVGIEDTGKFQVVRRMAKEGKTAAEIARAIQLGREEVELIMRMSGDGRS